MSHSLRPIEFFLILTSKLALARRLSPLLAVQKFLTEHTSLASAMFSSTSTVGRLWLAHPVCCILAPKAPAPTDRFFSHRVLQARSIRWASLEYVLRSRWTTLPLNKCQSHRLSCCAWQASSPVKCVAIADASKVLAAAQVAFAVSVVVPLCVLWSIGAA